MDQSLMNTLEKIISITSPNGEKIGAQFHKVHAEKGENLLNEGIVCHKLYYIVKGCLRLFYIDSRGREHTRFMAFENTFLTSMTSFISRNPSTEYIQVVEESVLYAITYDRFQELRVSTPVWNEFYIYILEYGITVITSRLNNLLTKSASERYRSLLSDQPELIQRLSNNDLAAYLNISPETLSRLKSNLTQQ